MIRSKDISVVIQGPYHPEWTPQTLASVRRILPESEVILSCWRSDAVPAAGALVDVILLNDDPGALDYAHLERDHPRFAFVAKGANLNRQLVSTRSGLEVASRRFSLKLRSDALLDHTGFAETWEHAPRVVGSRCTEDLIVTTDHMSPDRSALLYFVQDFAFFGLTADVRRLFEAPLIDPHCARVWTLDEHLAEFAPYTEQYLWIHLFSNRMPIYMRHCWDRNDAAVAQCRNLLAAHACPLSFSEFGITLLKYPNWGTEFQRPWTLNWMLRTSYAEWLGWCGESVVSDVQEKRRLVDAYCKFLVQCVGTPHLLHFEVNVAHQQMMEFFRWVRANAPRVGA